MDRLSPTRRPDRKVGGHQKWRQLLFMHWPVPVEELRPLVPERLSLDLWEGQAYLGVVPFVMQDVAPSWLPSLFALDFLETNLRTYVHLDGEQPGVYFFSLDAASQLAVWAARIGWGLPYFYAHMHTAQDGDLISYHMTRRSGTLPHLSVEYTVGEELGPSQPDTFEFFLLERYLLYSQHRGRLMKGQVYHPPYPAQKATIHSCSENLIAAAGFTATTTPPSIVHYASGVDVEVFDLIPVG